MTTTTREQVGAALRVVQAVADTIREVGRAPMGTLYAGLMTAGCSYGQFERIVSILTGAGLVRREGDCLVWVG